MKFLSSLLIAITILISSAMPARASVDTVKLTRSIVKIVFFGANSIHTTSGFALDRDQLITEGNACLAAQSDARDSKGDTDIKVQYIDINDRLKVIQVPVRIVAIAPGKDLCILKVDAPHGIEPLKLEKDLANGAKRGSKVMVGGAPGGLFPILKEGTIAAPANGHFYPKWDKYLVVSLRSFDGALGSAVVNSNNKVIGIVIGIYDNKKDLPEFIDITLATDSVEVDEFIKPFVK